MQIIRTSAGNGALGAAAAGITAANAAMQGALDRRLQLDEQQVRSAMQMRQMRDRQAEAKMQQAYRAEQDMLRNERADEALRMQRERLKLDRERQAQTIARAPGTRRSSQVSGADILAGVQAISAIDPATGEAIMSNIQEIVGPDQPVTPELLDNHPARAFLFQEITRAKDAALEQATKDTIDAGSSAAIKGIDALDPKFLQTDEGSTLVADLLMALEGPKMTPQRAEALIEGFERKAEAAITREQDRQKYLDIFTKASDGFMSVDEELLRDLKRSIAKSDNPRKAWLAAKSMLDPDMREALDDQLATFETQLANERALRMQAAAELKATREQLDGMTGPDRKGKTGPPTPPTPRSEEAEAQEQGVAVAPPTDGPNGPLPPSPTLPARPEDFLLLSGASGQSPSTEQRASVRPEDFLMIAGASSQGPSSSSQPAQTERSVPVAPPTDGPNAPPPPSPTPRSAPVAPPTDGPDGPPPPPPLPLGMNPTPGFELLRDYNANAGKSPALPYNVAFSEEGLASVERQGPAAPLTEESHPGILRAIILEGAKAQGATDEQVRYLREILARGLTYGSEEELAFRRAYVPQARNREIAMERWEQWEQSLMNKSTHYDQGPD